MVWWNWCRRRIPTSVANPDLCPRDEQGGRPAWDTPTDEYELPLERRRALGRSRQGRHW